MKKLIFLILSLFSLQFTYADLFCTQEAKLCSDGKTYVSRTGPNCEFSACPVVKILSEKEKIQLDILISKVIKISKEKSTFDEQAKFLSQIIIKLKEIKIKKPHLGLYVDYLLLKITVALSNVYPLD